LSENNRRRIRETPQGDEEKPRDSGAKQRHDAAHRASATPSHENVDRERVTISAEQRRGLSALRSLQWVDGWNMCRRVELRVAGGTADLYPGVRTEKQLESRGVGLDGDAEIGN